MEEKKKQPKKTSAKAKKGLPTAESVPIINITRHNVIGEINVGGAFNIIVTNNEAIITSPRYRVIYDNPTNAYLMILDLIKTYQKEDKTEEEVSMCDNLSKLFVDNFFWHILYFDDTKLCNDMWEYHSNYLNNKLNEAQNSDNLPEDDPTILQIMREEYEAVDVLSNGKD
jgi:hypothetical protein